MPSLAARLLLCANRLLPRPALPGRADPASYARWEFDTSEPVLRLWRRLGVRPRRVLDLGCGLGGKTHALWNQLGEGAQVIALDLSPTHLRQADAYHHSVGVRGITKIAADAAQLPFAEGSFDLIVTADTLEHLPRPEQALAEMRRCLSRGGHLLLVFNPWGSPRGSHMADLVHLPWCQLWFPRAAVCEAARLEARRQARHANDPVRAAEIERFAESLVEHFQHHVHPTRISDLRRWLRVAGSFATESELRMGPGPLRAAGPLLRGPHEEWLTASYGVILRAL